MTGFGLLDIEETPKRRFKRTLPTPQPVFTEKNSLSIADEFLEQKTHYITKTIGVDYVQGQDKCPICGGTINYIWEKARGFTIYECSDNDCLLAC